MYTKYPAPNVYVVGSMQHIGVKGTTPEPNDDWTPRWLKGLEDTRKLVAGVTVENMHDVMEKERGTLN